MKKILFILLALCIFSCSNDDDNEAIVIPQPAQPAQSAIVGTWIISNFNVEDETFDLNNDGIASNELISETNCFTGEILKFNADGTASFNSTTYLDLTITVTNNIETYNFNCEVDAEVFNFTWAQLPNGSFVVISDGEQTPITLLANNTLSRPGFFEYETIFMDGNGNTTGNSFYESDVTVIYTRQ